MTFAHPWFLLLLAVVPLLIWHERQRAPGGLRFSSTAAATGIAPTVWTRMARLPAWLRIAAIVLGIVALARPQERNQVIEQSAEGVDIMMVLDLSTSMRAQDFEPNRFEAARAVAAEFIDSRLSDRVGLIVFAAQAFTQAPLTLDYAFLQKMLEDVEIGLIEDGTAIGTALATAVNRLKESEAESKVVILLTDGQNNRGEIDPATAADVAAALGVRVYPIGVGTYGEAPYVVDRPFGGQRRVQVPVEIDEATLQRVAEATGGQYFRATDREALREIYQQIGELEKTEIEQQIYTDVRERYLWFLIPAFLLLLAEIVLATTRLRPLP